MTTNSGIFKAYREGRGPTCELQEAALKHALGLGEEYESSGYGPVFESVECPNMRAAVDTIRDCALLFASLGECGMEIVMMEDEVAFKSVELTTSRYSTTPADGVSVELALLFDEDEIGRWSCSEDDLCWQEMFADALVSSGYEIHDGGFYALSREWSVIMMWLNADEENALNRLHEMGEAAREAYRHGVPLVDLVA